MKVTREEFDFMLGRSRGCIGRVRASAGAAPTRYGRRAVAAAKGASMQISGEGKGLSYTAVHRAQKSGVQLHLQAMREGQWLVNVQETVMPWTLHTHMCILERVSLSERGRYRRRPQPPSERALDKRAWRRVKRSDTCAFMKWFGTPDHSLDGSDT